MPGSRYYTDRFHLVKARKFLLMVEEMVMRACIDQGFSSYNRYQAVIGISCKNWLTPALLPMAERTNTGGLAQTYKSGQHATCDAMPSNVRARRLF